MVSITIKGLKDGCHIYADFHQFDEFLECFQKRLQGWTLKGSKEVFFHLSSITIKEMVSLLSLCNQYQLYICSINEEVQSKSMQVLEQNLRSGEHYYFPDNTILFGNIEVGCEVFCKGCLYVIGSMYGNVDFAYAHCILYASKIAGNIQICDSSYHNVTSSAPLKLYYDKALLHKESLKEEHQWVKQLR